VDWFKKLIFKNKKAELISCRCRRGATGAIMAGAIMEEMIPLDEMSKR
jgi:hypothetical protein